jgi:hypothetical protein
MTDAVGTNLLLMDSECQVSQKTLQDHDEFFWSVLAPVRCLIFFCLKTKIWHLQASARQQCSQVFFCYNFCCCRMLVTESKVWLLVVLPAAILMVIASETLSDVIVVVFPRQILQSLGLAVSYDRLRTLSVATRQHWP